MAKLLLLLVLIGIAIYLFLAPNTRRWDKDPVQRQLATLMTAAALGDDVSAKHNLRDFLAAQRWQAREARQRIRHAVTLTRAALPDDAHARVASLGQYILDRNSSDYRITD